MHSFSVSGEIYMRLYLLLHIIVVCLSGVVQKLEKHEGEHI